MAQLLKSLTESVQMIDATGAITEVSAEGHTPEQHTCA